MRAFLNTTQHFVKDKVLRDIRFVKLFGYLFLCVAVLYACNNNESIPKKPEHVLLIGVDGAYAPAVQKVKTPNIDLIVQNGSVTWNAYTGGILGTPSQQTTYSGPGWDSMLTGVWANKHGIKSNFFRDLSNLPKYPHLFTRIRERMLSAYLVSVVTWTPINRWIMSDSDYFHREKSDSKTVQLAIEQIKRFGPTVLFVHLDSVDWAGHKHGFRASRPEYAKAIAKIDDI